MSNCVEGAENHWYKAYLGYLVIVMVLENLSISDAFESLEVLHFFAMGL